MIYESYWQGITNVLRVHHSPYIQHVMPSAGVENPQINRNVYLKALYEAIRDPNNSFVFIITIDQEESFYNWIRQQELTNYIAFKGPWTRNTNSRDLPRRLQIVVLQHPDHLQRRNIVLNKPN
jgi:hypothetical protein